MVDSAKGSVRDGVLHLADALTVTNSWRYLALQGELLGDDVGVEVGTCSP